MFCPKEVQKRRPKTSKTSVTPAYAQWAGYAIGAAIVFLSASSVIAAVGTMLPVAYPKPVGAAFRKHYQILIKSVGLTLTSAMLYGLVQYGTVGVRVLPT